MLDARWQLIKQKPGALPVAQLCQGNMPPEQEKGPTPRSMTVFYFLQYECPHKRAGILEASSQSHLLQSVLLHYAFSITIVIFLMEKKRKKRRTGLGETKEIFHSVLPPNSYIRQKAWNTYSRTLKSKQYRWIGELVPNSKHH